jgi:hypothetical protein
VRQFHVGPVIAPGRPVAAAGDDRQRGDVEPRAGNHAFLDRPLDCHVGIAGAFRAEVAQGGEAGLQRRGGVLASEQGAVFDRFLHHLLVPAGFIVGVQQDVRVQVHQAWHECLAGQVDAFGVARHGDAGRRADRLDASMRD